MYSMKYYLIKNAKVKLKSTVVNKIILYSSCIMHQNFLKEARLGASFDSPTLNLFYIRKIRVCKQTSKPTPQKCVCIA